MAFDSKYSDGAPRRSYTGKDPFFSIKRPMANYGGQLMSLSHYSTGAAFQVPSEGIDGSDGYSSSMASTLEEAKADIRQAYREFHLNEVARIEVLPMANGRQLLAVYVEDTNVDPQLLVFQGETDDTELEGANALADAS
jgi:hypothetical protein